MESPSPQTGRHLPTEVGEFQRRRRRVPAIYAVWLMDRLRDRVMRGFDFLLALALLVGLSPLWLIVLLASLRQSPHVVGQELVGRWYVRFVRYRVNLASCGIGEILRRWHLDAFPALLPIVRGDMAFVGPRAVRPGEISPRDRVARLRYEVRPGLVGPWWVKHRGSVDFDPEPVVDAEYVATRSAGGDLGVLARAGFVLTYGGGGQAITPDQLDILRIPIHNLSMSDALDALVEIAGGDQTRQVAFVNADCANIAYRDSDYLAILQECALVLADGIGMKLAGQMLHKPIRQNVNGTDLFPLLCELLSGTSQGIFLLGGKPGIAEGVAEWVREHNPGVTVSGYHDGFFTPEEEPDVIAEIAASGAAVLLVAFGVPRQEKWLAEHLAQTNARLGMGVGGLFDFYSGRIPRAPLWMREIGLEWVYRFLQEPGRLWRRYFIGNAVFLWRVRRERRARPTE